MQPIPKDIINTAERLLYHNELLIEQCDRWLSAEEGNRNMERKIYERKKREAAKAWAVYRNALRPKTWSLKIKSILKK